MIGKKLKTGLIASYQKISTYEIQLQFLGFTLNGITYSNIIAWNRCPRGRKYGLCGCNKKLGKDYKPKIVCFHL